MRETLGIVCGDVRDPELISGERVIHEDGG